MIISLKNLKKNFINNIHKKAINSFISKCQMNSNFIQQQRRSNANITPQNLLQNNELWMKQTQAIQSPLDKYISLSQVEDVGLSPVDHHQFNNEFNNEFNEQLQPPQQDNDEQQDEVMSIDNDDSDFEPEIDENLIDDNDYQDEVHEFVLSDSD